MEIEAVRGSRSRSSLLRTFQWPCCVPEVSVSVAHRVSMRIKLLIREVKSLSITELVTIRDPKVTLMVGVLFALTPFFALVLPISFLHRQVITMR